LRLATIRQTVKPTVTSTASQKTPSRMASQSGRVTSGGGGDGRRILPGRAGQRHAAWKRAHQSGDSRV
jgi:hypothetical protein